MHFCKECRNICELFDDLIEKKLFNICNHCNYKVLVNNNTIYHKSFEPTRESLVDNMGIIYQDLTLPKNNARVCNDCASNDIVFIRNKDLSLTYICKKCNTIITE